MKVKELLEFCQICPFCDNPMPLFCRANRMDRSIDIKDGEFHIFVSASQGNLAINLNRNSWLAPKASARSLSATHMSIGRKCDCTNKTYWKSMDLLFDEENVQEAKLDSLAFQKNINQDKILVTSNYVSEHTSIFQYKLDSEYFISYQNFYKQFPLINFDFSSKEKIEEKLKMIMTFL